MEPGGGYILVSRKSIRRVLPVEFLPGEFLCMTSPVLVQSSRALKAVSVETWQFFCAHGLYALIKVYSKYWCVAGWLVKFPVLGHRNSPNPSRDKLPVCGRWSQVVAPRWRVGKIPAEFYPSYSYPVISCVWRLRFRCYLVGLRRRYLEGILLMANRALLAGYPRSMETFTTIALFMSSLVTIYTNIWRCLDDVMEMMLLS